MSETIDHTRLVGIIITWVKSEYSGIPGFCVFCDCPPVLETEKPSSIEGFYPDVCGAATPPAVTVLGEAKTLPDLESPRSYQQILAFFRFLAARPQPTFVIAVPWFAKTTAKHIINRAKQETHAEGVRVFCLTDQSTSC